MSSNLYGCVMLEQKACRIICAVICCATCLMHCCASQHGLALQCAGPFMPPECASPHALPAHKGLSSRMGARGGPDALQAPQAHEFRVRRPAAERGPRLGSGIRRPAAARGPRLRVRRPAAARGPPAPGTRTPPGSGSAARGSAPPCCRSARRRRRRRRPGHQRQRLARLLGQ